MLNQNVPKEIIEKFIESLFINGSIKISNDLKIVEFDHTDRFVTNSIWEIYESEFLKYSLLERIEPKSPNIKSFLIIGTVGADVWRNVVKNNKVVKEIKSQPTKLSSKMEGLLSKYSNFNDIELQNEYNRLETERLAVMLSVAKLQASGSGNKIATCRKEFYGEQLAERTDNISLVLEYRKNNK